MLKGAIVHKGKEIGFMDVRFTHAGPFVDYGKHLKKLKDHNLYPPFVTDNIELRTEPSKILASCKTIIAVAMSYKDIMDISIENPPPRSHGYITPSAWHRDYHILLKEAMEELINYIDAKTNYKFKFRSFVDTGHLSDREVAKRAGLGYVGKNSSIITYSSGSYVWLGHILTDLELEPDKELENQCGDCRKCIDSCPTGAINEDGTIIYDRCLANVLIQKGELPEELQKKMDRRIYGCDTCQLACPKNKLEKSEKENLSEIKLGWIDLNELDQHSNKTFKEKYGHSAFSWRGKSVLKRNADIVRGKNTDTD